LLAVSRCYFAVFSPQNEAFPGQTCFPDYFRYFADRAREADRATKISLIMRSTKQPSRRALYRP
jgi:hypothetical protein